jgi:hypothetical protein
MKKILIAGALLILASGASMAATVCADGATNSFANNVTLDLTFVNTCTVGSTVFSNFTITGENLFVPSSFSASANYSGNVLSFTFTNLTTTNGTSSSGVGGVGDIFLSFQSSNPLSSIILGGGSTNATTETICTAAFSGENCGGTVLGTNTASGGASVTINVAGYSTIEFIGKDIAGGSGLTQTIGSSVPEPMTLSMMGFGLLGLGLIARRRKS